MTCLGINNEGKLVFDYYHQDYGENSVSGIKDVYNGKPSVLWTNFHEAFADKIKTTYQSWRVSGSEKLSYNKIVKYFIDDQTDRWSISMYNEDSEFKYISQLRNKNNPEWLYQVRGTGEEHLKYMAKNRMMFCDSKWLAGDFMSINNRIILRTHSPNITGKFAPSDKIAYKTFSNMYASVRYGTNSNPLTKYTPKDTLVVFERDDAESNDSDTDTYIFGADQISYLDDLSLLYCSTLNISAATKLLEINVGRDEEGYENTGLQSISFTNNRLLRKVNVCNCTGFTTPKVLNFESCPDIQEILATGSNITGIDLPDSGYLKIAKLPATIETLKIVNQKYIQTFSCEGYSNLKSIRIENSVNVPISDILNAIVDDKYPNVRIVNMEWNVKSESEFTQIINKLIKCKALDASGLATNDMAVVTGKVIVNSAISDELRTLVHQHFPELVIVDNTGTAFYFVDYLTIDGNIYETKIVTDNETPELPTDDPDDIIMENHRYIFKGWDMSNFKPNQNNRISGIWDEQFAVKFYVNSDDVEYVDLQWISAGDAATDPVASGKIDTPVKQGNDDIRYEFNSWKDIPDNVQFTVNVYAVFDNIYPVRYYATESSKTPHYIQWIKEGEAAYDPVAAKECSAPEDIIESIEKKFVFAQWINIPSNVSAITNVYCKYDTYWSANFFNDGELYLVEWVLHGSDVVEPKDYFENYTNPTRKSTAQYHYHFSRWDGNFKAVTESRSYHAEYTEELRKYNVHFYSGDKLLQTKTNVSYGSNTSYTGSTPVKQGVDNPEEYVFKGWGPEPNNITGETKCYAIFKFTGYLFGKLAQPGGTDEGYGTVDNPNWDKIAEHWDVIAADVKSYRNGSLNEDEFIVKYPIGGRMIIPIKLTDGTNTIADVEIVAHNHDNLAGGSGKAVLTFFCKDLPVLEKSMNSNGSTNAGGWKDTAIRSFLNGEFFNYLPEKLKKVISPVLKISDGGHTNRTLVTTEDKCWLASCTEVNLAETQNMLPGQGVAYSSIFTDGKSRMKILYGTAEYGRWWLRSSYYADGSKDMFYRITNNTGNAYQNSCSSEHYIAFGFCI